jgi:DNA polymerase-4
MDRQAGPSPVRARPAEPILHVDLDAFYASVEVLKNPSLTGKPVVVGHGGARGVVMSASYEARAAGLYSAMPSARARRICPSVVFVPPDFDSYRAYSNRFREILLSFTPVVEPISLDEAFLDVSGAMLLFGEPVAVGQRIRETVRAELSLGASVGIGATKLVAKLASTKAKPDGLLAVQASKTVPFLHALPVGDLWGVGDRTAELMGRLGIRTVAELARTPRSILGRVLGEGQAEALLALAAGRDARPVVPFEAPKSVSHEETFARDLDLEEEILRELLSLSHRVAARLRTDGYQARTITVKLRLPSFATFTRSRTLRDPTDLGADIYAVVRDLVGSMPPGRRRYRLLGVVGSGLVPAGAHQVALVEEGRWGDAERALDRVARRFGPAAAMPAALLERARRPPPVGNDEPREGR